MYSSCHCPFLWWQPPLLLNASVTAGAKRVQGCIVKAMVAYCFLAFHCSAFPSLFPYQWPLSRGGVGRKLQELVVLFIAHCYDKQPSNTSHKIRNYNDGTGEKFFVGLRLSLPLCQKLGFLGKTFVLVFCPAKNRGSCKVNSELFSHKVKISCCYLDTDAFQF